MVADSFQMLAHPPFFMYSEKSELLEREKKEMMYVLLAVLLLWTLLTSFVKLLHFPQLCKQGRCGNCKNIF